MLLGDFCCCLYTEQSFFSMLPAPFFCDRKGFGEPSLHTCRKVDDLKPEIQGFGSGLYSCRLSPRATVFQCRRFTAPLTWRSYHIGRNFCTKTTKLFEGHSMAGADYGSNAAREASYTTESFKTDQIETELDSTKATTASSSLPGLLCNSVTTVGKSTNIVWQECMVKKEERQKLLRQKGCVIWITGLSGSGKSTLACTLDHALLNRGNLSYVIDGDNLRHGLNNNLGFCSEDRTENIRRVGEVAKLFADAGVICIASVISPYRKDRDTCRQLVHTGEFIEVHMNFPVSLCEERDPKGLYKLARAGKIKGFTGVDDPYEAPVNCEVVMQQINGRCPTPAEMACQLISFLEEKSILGPPRQ